MIDLIVPGRKDVHGGQAGSIFIKDHGLAILRHVGIHPIIQILLFLDVRLISLERGPLSPAGAFTEMPGQALQQNAVGIPPPCRLGN